MIIVSCQHFEIGSRYTTHQDKREKYYDGTLAKSRPSQAGDTESLYVTA